MMHRGICGEYLHVMVNVALPANHLGVAML